MLRSQHFEVLHFVRFDKSQSSRLSLDLSLDLIDSFPNWQPSRSSNFEFTSDRSKSRHIPAYDFSLRFQLVTFL